MNHLAAIGVDHVFGVDGANIEDLYDAAHFHPSLCAILAKHEFSAAAMADGYSRSGCGLGVVAATSGGGALNLVAGLGRRWQAGYRCLPWSVNPPRPWTAGRLSGHQRAQRIAGCRSGVLRGVAIVSAGAGAGRDCLGPAACYCRGAHRRSGCVVAAQGHSAGMRGDRGAQGVAGEVRPIGNPHPITRILRRANGPVTMIVGEQVARDDCRPELEQLRAVLRARVATVPEAKDVTGIPGSDPRRRWGDGSHGPPERGRRGGRQRGVPRRRHPLARHRPRRPGRSAGRGANGVDRLSAAVPSVHPRAHRRPARLAAHPHPGALGIRAAYRPAGARHGAAHRAAAPPWTGPGVRYRDAMAVLNDALPDGTDIVVDAGNTGAAAIHYLGARRGGRFAVALGMGGMGYSFGAGIGMALGRANSGRPAGRTVVIAGDGAFFMHGMEVHTAVQYRLPVTFVLFNNNAHAMCVTREQLFYGDLYSYNRFRCSRLGSGLAEMFPGLTSVDVADVEHFATAMRAAVGLDGPAVVSVECAAGEIPPFAPFLVTPIAEEYRTDVAASA
ncbi:thiamine pyrophosphate enzyme, C-terminal TPP binding domain protein [Mycobacterium kansasii]|uniref:acetolactate synthase n=1 Tax=Mycobacterium kansasii TaxID=1768 RepID=A0A1V3WK47_MYCKA|nr:thiamine pyrophosphate enzyme, C-terminal TPP binding domain protein [Mycobacterium kansasii]